MNRLYCLCAHKIRDYASTPRRRFIVAGRAGTFCSKNREKMGNESKTRGCHACTKSFVLIRGWNIFLPTLHVITFARTRACSLVPLLKLRKWVQLMLRIREPLVNALQDAPWGGRGTGTMHALQSCNAILPSYYFINCVSDFKRTGPLYTNNKKLGCWHRL